MNPRSLQIRPGPGRPPLTPFPAALAQVKDRVSAYRERRACPDCSTPPHDFTYHTPENPCPWKDGSRRWQVARFFVRHPDALKAVVLTPTLCAMWWGISARPGVLPLVGLLISGSAVLKLVRSLDVRA